MSIQELTPKLNRLRPAEKAEVVRKLVQNITNVWPGIEKIPGVADGDACIVRTRIPVWALENYRRLGLSESQILANYPSLRAADLVNAWAYAEAHIKEIRKSIQENEGD
jgi:uncharacterized protein (DUF433 family)